MIAGSENVFTIFEVVTTLDLSQTTVAENIPVTSEFWEDIENARVTTCDARIGPLVTDNKGYGIRLHQFWCQSVNVPYKHTLHSMEFYSH